MLANRWPVRSRGGRAWGARARPCTNSGLSLRPAGEGGISAAAAGAVAAPLCPESRPCPGDNRGAERPESHRSPGLNDLSHQACVGTNASRDRAAVLRACTGPRPGRTEGPAHLSRPAVPPSCRSLFKSWPGNRFCLPPLHSQSLPQGSQPRRPSRPGIRLPHPENPKPDAALAPDGDPDPALTLP